MTDTASYDVTVIGAGPAGLAAALEADGAPYRLIVCTDHRTPIAKRGHTSDPVPFAWVDGPLGAGAAADAAAAFDEFLPAAGQPPLVCDVVSRLLK